ncbi:MAG: nuclear transport factor 2 family protein [Sulfuricellaceae bacterium]|jgi:hypothetical protein
MKPRHWAAVAAFLLTFFQVPAFAGEGEKLVRQFWNDMATQNIAAIEKYLAPGFQSIHQDGARDRAGEITLLKGLNMKKYSLSDFKETENGPVVIVTYFASTHETIGGKELSSKPAPRMSAWLKTGQGWQLIMHANLNPLK